jgi:hypothetical protein
MSALNLDIINLILDLLIWNYDGSVDRPSLATASRINRLWRAPAQSRLFETVQILSRQELNSFLRSTPTSSRRGRQLRAMVLQLDIGISGHTSVMGVAPSHSLLERDMISLLPTLPNLYILVVTSIAPAISRAGRKALASLKTPQIRSLAVHYIGEPPDRTHQIFLNLLSVLPVERAVFIGKGTYVWPSSLPPGTAVPESPPIDLKELRIDLRHSQPSVKGSDLAWLIGHSLNSLEILHLYDLVLDPSMTPFILSVAEQLRSFHVSSSRQSDLRELPFWVEKMVSLHELVIRNDMLAAECFRVQTDLPRLMKVVPGTLQHLGLAVESQIALEILKYELCSWEERLGVSLPVLTVVSTSTDPINEQWQGGGRLRLFHHTDKDVVFSFVSKMTSRIH